MKPMYMEMKGDNIVIYHKCISCKILKKNKASREDNLSILYEEKK